MTRPPLNRFWICHACLHDWRRRYERAGLLGFDDFTMLTLHYPKPGQWWDCQFCHFWPAKWTVRTSPEVLRDLIRYTEAARKTFPYPRSHKPWIRRPGALTQLAAAVPAMLWTLVLFAIKRK